MTTALFLTCLEAWGFNPSYYYARVDVSNSKASTGEGTIYANRDEEATSGDEPGNSITTPGGNVTVYLFATPAEHSVFLGWATADNTTNVIAGSNTSTFEATYQASNTAGETNARVYNRYAVFMQLPLFRFSAAAVAQLSQGGAATATEAGGTVSATSEQTEIWGTELSQTEASTVATFTATANDTYYFVGWTATEGKPDPDDGLAGNPLVETITNTTPNSTLSITRYGIFARYDDPTAVTVSNPSVQMTKGDTYTVTYTVLPDLASTYKYVIFSSDHPEIAMVDATTGVVTGMADGTATITVTAYKTDKTTPSASTTVAVTVVGKAATPVIVVTTGEDGQNYVSITSSDSGVTFRYTTDGSTPSRTSTEYTGPFALTSTEPEVTIKAIALHDGRGDSDVATHTYVRGSGTSDGVVYLNDYEDHTWTYYAGVDPAVDGGNYNNNYRGILYSPAPRNVKITYNGVDLNGNLGTTVAVSRTESENVFIYYKTLEQGSTVGEYPYQVISNPFSKRPSTGTRTKTYYGFAGWRIKEGAQYIRRADGRMATDEAVLNLDEEITFVGLPYPSVNCTSAEIVFETTWAQANVTNITYSRNTTINNNGTYETNLVVVQTNMQSTLTINSPCTIMMVAPDGSADYTNYTMTSAITPVTGAGNTTKIEHAHWNPGNAINPQGRNLTIGRGMTMNGTARAIYGTDTNTTVNQVLKIESGRFSSFYHFNTGLSRGNFVKQIVTFGNDYDRAKGDNSKLDITGACKISNGSTLNINHDQMMTQTYSKSGRIMSGVSVGSAASGNVYYFGMDGNNEANYLGGCRYLEIQGGEWCSIAGGFDQYHTSEDMAFTLRMRGGLIRGSVYGGGEFYGATGCRRYVLTGGQIKGWLAAGANGTRSDGGTTNGQSYVYVGGNSSVDSENNNAVINRAIGGNVFGAGCGYNTTSSSGEMTNGTNVVVADNAYVERGVYGGGAYGFTNVTSNVYVTGGHVAGLSGGVSVMNGNARYDANIHGGVFGGACQNKGGTVKIYMTGGTVEGGLYGGSNSNGTIAGDVRMVVAGGQMGTEDAPASVHGGGYGASTVVSGNVDVTVGVEGATDGVTAYGDIYGGSALGKVNGATPSATLHTNVSLHSGTVRGSLYGGGLGDGTHAADVYGPVTVNVSGGNIIHNVFGGNNTNGSPRSGITVNYFSSGTIGGGIYGGGNLSDTQCDPKVRVWHGVTHNIFGGGLSADVDGSTDVRITGTTTVKGNVYGGGDEGDVTGKTYVQIGEDTAP